MSLPWEATAEGLRLAVRVTPRASTTAFAGIVGTADGGSVLAIRLAAPPVDGAANAALLAFLAKALGIRKSDVTLSAGSTTRLKRIVVAGDAAALGRRLLDLVGER